MTQSGKILFCLMVAFLLATGAALANKSTVTIMAPESVAKGTEVTIKLNVTHHGNNLFHHTQWLYIRINGKEIARWDFSATHRPEAGNFTREVNFTVNETAQIEAEASCNIHGSAGAAKATIRVK